MYIRYTYLFLKITHDCRNSFDKNLLKFLFVDNTLHNLGYSSMSTILLLQKYILLYKSILKPFATIAKNRINLNFKFFFFFFNSLSYMGEKHFGYFYKITSDLCTFALIF